MKTYTLAEDEGYGWVTGATSDGRQVLAADIVNLFFNASGEFMQMAKLNRITEWVQRSELIISVRKPIHILPFAIPNESIGLRPIQNSNLFEFLLGDEFWINPDGSVNSH